MLGSLYTSVNFEADMSPGSPNWWARMECDRARSQTWRVLNFLAFCGFTASSTAPSPPPGDFPASPAPSSASSARELWTPRRPKEGRARERWRGSAAMCIDSCRWRAFVVSRRALSGEISVSASWYWSGGFRDTAQEEYDSRQPSGCQESRSCHPGPGSSVLPTHFTLLT